jgi:hypothetical protein
VPLTPSSQRAGPLSVYFTPDPIEFRLAVVQPKILVEAAQHQRKLLLLIPPLPVPMLAEPFLATRCRETSTVSASFGIG